VIENSRRGPPTVDGHNLPAFALARRQNMIENVRLILPALPMLGSPIQTDFSDIAYLRNQFVEQWQLMSPLSR
jgi:hypothetical protein